MRKFCNLDNYCEIVILVVASLFFKKKKTSESLLRIETLFPVINTEFEDDISNLIPSIATSAFSIPAKLLNTLKCILLGPLTIL